MNHNERLKLAIQHCAAIKHELDFSYGWLSQEKIDVHWVKSLKDDEIKKERVSGFCSRFGRFQDYLADKVLRCWLEATGEKVGTAIENFSIAERVGVLTMPSEEMLEIRVLRNKLAHEYEENPDAFAANLQKMILVTDSLSRTYNNIVAHCHTHLGMDV